ncbi:MAG: magnesium chelatase, partial [Prolixibacteraceae bacterium]
SSSIRGRVISARNIQSKRFKDLPGVFCNAQMSSRQVREHVTPGQAGNLLLKNAMDKLGLSARAYDRILRVARTIADLEHSVQVEAHHISEAIQYRSLDRESWGA